MAGIIDGATRLHQLDAADILVPRQKIVFLSGRHSRADVLKVIRESGHSRFPFTVSGNLDELSAVVLAKDVLFSLQKESGAIDWQAMVREPMVVPETKPLNALLQMFRTQRQHLAIVVDEYGGTEGIVTLEDVLEELVGDIIDESDRPPRDLAPQPDGSLHALASVEMRKLCTHLGVEWDHSEDVVTLGGLVSVLLERIPQVGDVLDWHGYRLEVLAATPTHAQLVKISQV